MLDLPMLLSRGKQQKSQESVSWKGGPRESKITLSPANRAIWGNIIWGYFLDWRVEGYLLEMRLLSQTVGTTLAHCGSKL